MRRTQLHLAEECARVQAAESQRRGTTVSALVRDAVEQVFGGGSACDRATIIDRLAGVWSDRDDPADPEPAVRPLRRSQRSERLQGGGGGEVPARQRRRHRLAAA